MSGLRAMQMPSSISTLRVYLERGTVPVRSGRPQSRRNALAVAASSPDKSNASSGTPASPPESSGSDIKVDASPETSDEGWQQPFSPAQIFGSYLQVGVWVVVLSVAGFTGFQKVRECRSSRVVCCALQARS